MRFEHIAAYILGVVLPLLEVLRRGTHLGSFPSYIDDFIAGGLLLYAASAVSRKKENGAALLVVAWAIVCGGLYYSFFGQLQNLSSHDISGLPNMVVVLTKGTLS